MGNKTLIKRIITGIILVLIAVFVYFNFSAFVPILLALLTAMIFEPFVRMLKKQLKTEKRVWPVTIVFTLFLLLSSIFFHLMLTRAFDAIYQWSSEIPRYAFEIQRFANEMIVEFNQIIAEIPQGNMIIRELERLTQDVVDAALGITTNLVATLASWLQSIPTLLVVFLVFLVTLFLFSLDLPRLLNNFFNLFKEETSNKLRYILHRMGKVFIGYWKAQFILSLGVFALTYLILLLIAPDLALLISIIVWVVDIIPLYVGPALVLVPWALLAFILSDITLGIQLLVLTLVLLVLRRIIEPKVIGDSIGLHALPTVLSMYFGFVFFGVMGLIAGPFVYMAFKTAYEAGLFNIRSSGKDQRPEEEKSP